MQIPADCQNRLRLPSKFLPVLRSRMLVLPGEAACLGTELLPPAPCVLRKQAAAVRADVNVFIIPDHFFLFHSALLPVSALRRNEKPTGGKSRKIPEIRRVFFRKRGGFVPPVPHIVLCAFSDEKRQKCPVCKAFCSTAPSALRRICIPDCVVKRIPAPGPPHFAHAPERGADGLPETSP